ncbi:hypothetical protein CLOP_g7466 [Closterium sp. NIES-67]|nr:hypothetical protein CLOP_g7466 [Closterium sp. NIES-67]
MASQAACLARASVPSVCLSGSGSSAFCRSDRAMLMRVNGSDLTVSSGARVVASQSRPGGKASMKKAPGAVVFRTDDPLAGRDYRPPMPGDEPDFWEGSQWDLLGFVAEYLWVFGIVLAIVSSLYAVTSYNQDDGVVETADSSVTVESSAPSEADQLLEPFVDDAPPL